MKKRLLIKAVATRVKSANKISDTYRYELTFHFLIIQNQRTVFKVPEATEPRLKVRLGSVLLFKLQKQS